MKLYRTICISVTIVLAGLMSTGCSWFRKDEMVRFGPDVQANLVIYFKAGVSNAEVSRFWNETLSNPHPSGKGTWPKDGIGEIAAVSAVQGHEGVSIRFVRMATVAQREKVKADINSSPLVYRVLENIAPQDVKKLN